MGNEDWFRRTTWTDADRQDFETKLAKAPASNRSQYLRIQAVHLAEVGTPALLKAALELLDRLLTGHPDEPIQLAAAHAQRADCLCKLGDVPAAISAFRATLQAERAFRGVQTNAWLDFGWLVVRDEITDLYPEIALLLDERASDPAALAFPVLKYKYHAIRALLAGARGQRDEALAQARMALEARGQEDSGFRHHRDLGLAGSADPEIHARLRKLVG